MQTLLGLAPLLRQSLSGADLSSLGQALIQRANSDSNDSAALMDAAILMQFRGQHDLAMELQREALKIDRQYQVQSSRPVRLNLLGIVAPGELMANVPLECLLEDSDIGLTLHYATAEEANAEDFSPSQLPDHDLLFVAIGESDTNRPLLDAWQPRLTDWPKPVINPPQAILRTARDLAHRFLSDIPGVLAPPTWRLDQGQIQTIIAQGHFFPTPPDSSPESIPLILRPVDSHAGQGLIKTESNDEFLTALAAFPNQEVFLSPFIDYRSEDGLYRKYRIVLIDGQPFACHMASSQNWMIHYLNAGMEDSEEKRAEEAAFMANFEQDFALRHGEALAAIQAAVGLDYIGIDCAELRDGNLFIFEVDPAMVVHAMDPIDLYPYKQPAMRKIFDAFGALLTRRAQDTPEPSGIG